MAVCRECGAKVGGSVAAHEWHIASTGHRRFLARGVDVTANDNDDNEGGGELIIVSARS